MKVIKIDGKRYAIRPPFDDGTPYSKNSEWNRAMEVHCCINWRNTVSWCYSGFESVVQILRGGPYSIGYTSEYVSAHDKSYVFRPILIPLEGETEDMDRYAFANRDGETILLGSADPDDPYNIHDTIYRDVPLKWGVFDGKLIALEPLVYDVSWRTLADMGYIPDDARKNAIYLTEHGGETISPDEKFSFRLRITDGDTLGKFVGLPVLVVMKNYGSEGIFYALVGRNDDGDITLTNSLGGQSTYDEMEDQICAIFAYRVADENFDIISKDELENYRRLKMPVWVLDKETGRSGWCVMTKQVCARMLYGTEEKMLWYSEYGQNWLARDVTNLRTVVPESFKTK